MPQIYILNRDSVSTNAEHSPQILVVMSRLIFLPGLYINLVLIPYRKTLVKAKEQIVNVVHVEITRVNQRGQSLTSYGPYSTGPIDQSLTSNNRAPM